MGLLDKADNIFIKNTLIKKKGGLLKNSLQYLNKKEEVPVKEDLNEFVKKTDLLIKKKIITEEIAESPGKAAGKRQKDVHLEFPEDSASREEDISIAEFSGLKDGEEYDVSVDENVKYLAGDMAENLDNVQGEKDLAGYLTAIFVKYLEIKQIACLMFNPLNDDFVVWKSIGFDKDTISRLTMTSDFVKRILIPDTNLFYGTSEKIDSFSPFFNHNDYINTRSLLLMPFLSGDRIIGFLIMLNISPDYLALRDFTSLFSNHLNNILLVKNRARKIDEILTYAAGNQQELTEKVEKKLEYATGNKTVFKLLKLSIEKSIQPVLIDNPMINTWVLKEDVLLLLGKLFKHIGEVYNLKDDKILFTIYKLRVFDMDVLKDQLLKTIEHYFEEILKDNMFQLEFEIYSYPEQGKEIPALLSAIL